MLRYNIMNLRKLIGIILEINLILTWICDDTWQGCPTSDASWVALDLRYIHVGPKYKEYICSQYTDTDICTASQMQEAQASK
jgi:hypothetical protein